MAFLRSVVASIFAGSFLRSAIDWTIWRLCSRRLRIDIHQADGAVLQTGRQQDIAAEISGEYQASSTNEGNLRHNYFYSDSGEI